MTEKVKKQMIDHHSFLEMVLHQKLIVVIAQCTAGQLTVALDVVGAISISRGDTISPYAPNLYQQIQHRRAIYRYAIG